MSANAQTAAEAATLTPYEYTIICATPHFGDVLKTMGNERATTVTEE